MADEGRSAFNSTVTLQSVDTTHYVRDWTNLFKFLSLVGNDATRFAVVLGRVREMGPDGNNITT